MIDQAKQILDQFYKTKEADCTCRPMVRNGHSLDFSTHSTQGCVLHCTHYGINTAAEFWQCSCGDGSDDDIFCGICDEQVDACTCKRQEHIGWDDDILPEHLRKV